MDSPVLGPSNPSTHRTLEENFWNFKKKFFLNNWKNDLKKMNNELNELRIKLQSENGLTES